MSRVFWDTNLFIYLIEDFGTRADQVESIRKRMLERGDRLVSSTLTVGELLAKPLKQARPELVQKYERLLDTSVELIDFDRTVARTYAHIRGASPGVRQPDAIQLACAASAEVDLFITNDDRLSRVVVSGVQFITSLDHAFL